MSFRRSDWKYLRYDIEDRWERLAIRKWINSNPGIIKSIAGISVVILLVVVINLLIPNHHIQQTDDSGKAWFYDLNTGKLFIAESDLAAPTQAPSGPLPDGSPAGVKAYVFSYVNDPNESQRFIGFLEMPDPNIAADKPNPNLSGAKLWGYGKLIRKVDTQWFQANTSQGQTIVSELFQPNENGREPIYHSPKSP